LKGGGAKNPSKMERLSEGDAKRTQKGTRVPGKA